MSVSYGLNRNAAEVWRQSIEWNERVNYTGRLSGEHTFRGLGGLEVEWDASHQDSDAEQPDRRYVEYKPFISFDPFTFTMDTTWVHKDNLRSWSVMTEGSDGYGLNATYPLRRETRFKAGVSTYNRERDFSIDNFSATAKPNGLPQATAQVFVLPPSEVFNGENFGPEIWQLDMIRTNAFTGEYVASHDLLSWYVMGDHVQEIFGQQFRLVGGVRVEDSDQKVITEEAEDVEGTVESRIDEKDVLPSANLTYVAHDDFNIRLAYSQSLNRPEFREMSAVQYYDFAREENVKGNPNLERAEVENYDIRLEWFPNIGEVVAFSYFYKDFTNAIEESLNPAAATRHQRSWVNSPKGKNWGYELEVRKGLGFIPWDYMRNFTMMANYTKVDSETDRARVAGDGKFFETGVMQGQSPWMVNVSLYFTEPRLGTTVSVLYNKIGRRLNAAGEKDWLDVYEEPRAVLDLAITQTLWYGSTLKFAAKDLYADDVLYTSIDENTVHSRYSKGSSYSLSLSFNL